MPEPTLHLTATRARRLWLHAQALDVAEPFGVGPEATPTAIAHLGYLQIDTIYVIERSHHHILHTRIPSYRREHLHQAQSIDKTVFEYWTHALSYLPIESFRFYVLQMRREWRRRLVWFGQVSPGELRRVVSRIRREGPITIRDVAETREAKEYAWGSRKPAKRALEAAFYKGQVAISRRSGMLKTYELLTRHFGWQRLPRAATDRETLNYLLDRSLRAQGLVSLDSASYLNPKGKPAMQRLMASRVRRKELIPVTVEGMGPAPHWIRPDLLDASLDPAPEQTHILSPFDPLVIQRKRFRQLFEYDYRFEAYVPRDRRVFGYFVCPILVGDRVVAALDLKTDRERGRLLVQRWHWIGRRGSREYRQRVDEALHRFERFQLATVGVGEPQMNTDEHG